MAQIVVGEESSGVFSAKYWERLVIICCIFSKSVKRELSSRKILDLVEVVGSINVREMGLWLDSIMGSIKA